MVVLIIVAVNVAGWGVEATVVFDVEDKVIVTEDGVVVAVDLVKFVVTLVVSEIVMVVVVTVVEAVVTEIVSIFYNYFFGWMEEVLDFI